MVYLSQSGSLRSLNKISVTGGYSADDSKARSEVQSDNNSSNPLVNNLHALPPSPVHRQPSTPSRPLEVENNILESRFSSTKLMQHLSKPVDGSGYNRHLENRCETLPSPCGSEDLNRKPYPACWALLQRRKLDLYVLQNNELAEDQMISSNQYYWNVESGNTEDDQCCAGGPPALCPHGVSDSSSMPLSNRPHTPMDALRTSRSPPASKNLLSNDRHGNQRSLRLATLIDSLTRRRHNLYTTTTTTTTTTTNNRISTFSPSDDIFQWSLTNLFRDNFRTTAKDCPTTRSAKICPRHNPIRTSSRWIDKRASPSGDPSDLTSLVSEPYQVEQCYPSAQPHNPTPSDDERPPRQHTDPKHSLPSSSVQSNPVQQFSLNLSNHSRLRTHPSVLQCNVTKRPRGRPRIHPARDPNSPKRARGRPRKNNDGNGIIPGGLFAADPFLLSRTPTAGNSLAICHRLLG
eukprot:GHVH01003525.1.p1 GENE.GHVH01003525.1~~GHVH01003525.1.p1  ORF type:complete len:461 (+),score=27.71 GHVH01003525.1:255-1637(+)